MSLAEIYARQIEDLVAAGHNPAAVWAYTPRQLRAFHRLLVSRRKREMAEYVAATQLATRGTNKEISKAIRKWLGRG